MALFSRDAFEVESENNGMQINALRQRIMELGSERDSRAVTTEGLAC